MHSGEKRESKSRRKISESSLHFSFELVSMPAERRFPRALLLVGGLSGNDSFPFKARLDEASQNKLG